MSEVQRKIFRVCPKIPCIKKVLHPKTVSAWPFKLMVTFILLTEYAHVIFLPHEENINGIKSEVRHQYNKVDELVGISRS